MDRQHAQPAQRTPKQSPKTSERSAAGPLAHEVAHIVGRPTFTQARKLFLDAVHKPDWATAAERLNGFRDEDITSLLESVSSGEFGVETLTNLWEGAEAAGQQGRGNTARVERFLAPLLDDKVRIREVYAEYDQAKAATPRNFAKMATYLNGMGDPDITARLGAADMDDHALRGLEDAVNTGMFGWAGRLHTAIVGQRATLAARSVHLPPAEPDGSPSKAVPVNPSPATVAKLSANQQAALTGRDERARSFGAANYDSYVRKMLIGGVRVFGQTIDVKNPVHPVLLRRLRIAEAIAAQLLGSRNFGVTGLAGFKDAISQHSWGFAVDIEAAADLYLLNESGEAELDAQLTQVYDRIATTLLGRPTVITPSTKNSPTRLAGATYDQLADENDAMIAYFSVLGPDSTPLSRPDKLIPLPELRAKRLQFGPEALAKLDPAQVRADYALMVTPKRTFRNAKGDIEQNTDGPGVGARPGSRRDPKRGFMGLNEHVVAALHQAGLVWGATDFGAASGDVMHFDGRSTEFLAEVAAFGAEHPTD